MKPTVVAGARDTRRFAAGENSGRHAQGLLDYARVDLVPGPGGAPLVLRSGGRVHCRSPPLQVIQVRFEVL